MQRRKTMSIGVRIGIAVLATVFCALTATTGVEEVFAFGAPARAGTIPEPAAAQGKTQATAQVTTQATTQATAQTAAPAGNVVEVKVDNFSFSPQAITIKPGTTVIWTNRDDIPHTVVSDDKVFKSRVLDTDEKFSYTFDKAGKFPYFCSVHPKMTGTVIVQ
jgi:plastocyanin